MMRMQAFVISMAALLVVLVTIVACGSGVESGDMDATMGLDAPAPIAAARAVFAQAAPAAPAAGAAGAPGDPCSDGCACSGGTTCCGTTYYGYERETCQKGIRL